MAEPTDATTAALLLRLLTALDVGTSAALAAAMAVYRGSGSGSGSGSGGGGGDGGVGGGAYASPATAGRRAASDVSPPGTPTASLMALWRGLQSVVRSERRAELEDVFMQLVARVRCWVGRVPVTAYHLALTPFTCPTHLPTTRRILAAWLPCWGRCRACVARQAPRLHHMLRRHSRRSRLHPLCLLRRHPRHLPRLHVPLPPPRRTAQTPVWSAAAPAAGPEARVPACCSPLGVRRHRCQRQVQRRPPHHRRHSQHRQAPPHPPRR